MSHDALSDEDKQKVAAMVDYFVEILPVRYDTTLAEVVAAAKWVKEHRESVARLQQTGLISVIGVLVLAAGTTLWEGLKRLLGIKP